ncbi:MAG: sugar nucleotide-binding protein, partial [Verrucomicrobiota bacterium]
MILILGGSGYVGQTFQAVLQSLGIDYKSLSRSAADYSQRSVLIKAIEELKPNFIINAAGYTGKPNVDQAELDKTECLRANAVLPGVVGEVCRDHEIPWGHVSSGCIFTGNNQGKGFSEEDAPNFTFRQNNCSFYSGTKALGEELLKDLSNCYIWRLRIPFHEINSPRNYLTKVMSYKRLLDVENSVSQLEEYVRACVKCWKEDFEFGTYNVTNPGFITTR